MSKGLSRNFSDASKTFDYKQFIESFPENTEECDHENSDEIKEINEK